MKFVRVVVVLLVVLITCQCLADDLDFLTPKGQEAIEEVIYAELTQPGVITSGPTYDKLRASAKLVLGSDDLDYFRIVLINSPEINAFAGIDKTIYVNEGLIKATQDNEELAWVVEHEIQHLIYGHLRDILFKRWQNENQFQMIAGQAKTLSQKDMARAASAIGFGSWLSELKYSRKAELQADREATLDLIDHGLAADAGVRFMKRLGEGGILPTFLSTHPKTSDRVENLADLVADQPYFHKCAVERDKPEFLALATGETTIPGYHVLSVGKESPVYVVSELPITQQKDGIKLQSERFWLVVVSPEIGKYWWSCAGWGKKQGDILLLSYYLTEDQSEYTNCKILALDLPKAVLVRRKDRLDLSIHWMTDPAWKPDQESDPKKEKGAKNSCPAFLE